MAMSKNEALIEVLLDRFINIRFPRIKDIKEKVEQGETLSTIDIEFFKEVFSDIKDNKHLVDGNKELQDMVAKIINYDKEIIDMALANEQKGQQ